MDYGCPNRSIAYAMPYHILLSGILTEFILYVKIHLNKICILYDLCNCSIRVDQWIGSMIKQTSLAWRLDHFDHISFIGIYDLCDLISYT